MSELSVWDDFNDDELGRQLQDPFPFIEYKNPDELFTWCTQELDNRLNAAQARLRRYRKNLAYFKGIHYRNMDTRDARRDDSTETDARKPKVVVNFMQEMLLTKVARNSQKKPSIAIMPNDDDSSSLNNCKAMQKIVRNRYDQVDIETVYADADTVRYLMGESYTFVEWDKFAGEISPDYKKLTKKLREKGKNIKDIKLKGGKKLEEVRVGDVVYPVKGPDVVLPQLERTKWEDNDDLMVIEYLPAKELQRDYPKLADKLTADDGEYMYYYNSLRIKRYYNMIRVVHYFHRKTKYLPEGRYVKFTNNCVLENDEYPYDHGNLPCARLTDIDVYGELHARSFFSNIVQLQRHFNAITSGVARNHGIASAPKWMMPKGACNIADLNNEFTVVEFRGAIAPKLAQSNPTGGEIFNYQDKLERWIEKSSIVTGTSRGEPPPGVTASVAMQFIDEQEQIRDNRNIAKRFRYIKDVYKLSLEVMEQEYKPDDERYARALGEDNEYMIESVRDVDFSAYHDVVVQNVSSLPESKAGRIQTIIDLNNSTNTSEEGPVFRRGEIVQMLDLGLDETFKDQISTGVKAAQDTIERIVKGKEVGEPQIYDEFEDQYPLFVRALQSRSFKDKLPSDAQVTMIKYIKTMEGLMWERSMKNMSFGQWLMTRRDFPLFFQPPMPLPPAPLPEEEGTPENIESQNTTAQLQEETGSPQ